MTELTTAYGVKLYGEPIAQGSMTCYGRKGGRAHNVWPNNREALFAWRWQVNKAGRVIPVNGITGPVGVEVTFTVERPASHYRTGRNAHRLKDAAPLWPCREGSGDVDKLARAVLDGLTLKDGHKVFGTDAQVVELTARKCYPDTPGCPDRLDKPGAIIRVYPIGE